MTYSIAEVNIGTSNQQTQTNKGSDMKGTEKQVNWAASIIGDNIRNLKNAYNENKERALELLNLRLENALTKGRERSVKMSIKKIAIMSDMESIFNLVLNADASEIINKRGHISSDNLIEERDHPFFEEDSHVWSLINQCSALADGFAEDKY